MTKKTSRHLLDILAEVPDFRNNRGKRHPLSAILALAVIAMMSGCQSYAAIAHWGRTYHKALAKALGFRHTKTPASTLHYVFKDIDATALENVTQWAIAVLENLPTDIQTQAIAMEKLSVGVINKELYSTSVVRRLSSTRHHTHTATRRCENQ